MTEEKTINKQGRIRERSAAYPAISLEEAIGYSIKLQTAFGKSPFSRENAVKEMGHEKVTGSSGMKVSALVYYGLLDRTGNAYRNSDLALRFSNIIDEDDLQIAKQLAVTKPKLYRDLIDEFAGRAIPAALNSILVRNHRIGQKVANSVASAFCKSLEYSGLYQNGIVSGEILTSENETMAENNPKQTLSVLPQNITRNVRPAIINTQQEMITVGFPSGVALSYPKDLAFAFAIGTFSAETAALEEAVQKEIKKHESANTKDDTSPAN